MLELKRRTPHAGHFASDSSSRNCALMLINKGADIEAVNDNFETPLHICCLHRDKWVSNVLVGSGANTSVTDKDLNTPLHNACTASCEDNAKLLIDAKAPLTASNKNKETPLSIACTFTKL